MRTITTNLYLFPELTPEAQEHAIDAHRERMFRDYWWADEIKREAFDSIKAFIEKHLEWSIQDYYLSDEAYRSELVVRPNTTEHEDEFRDMNKARTIKWFANNVLTGPYAQHSIGRPLPGICGLTGWYMDDSVIEYVWDEIKSGYDPHTAVENLRYWFAEFLSKEIEYRTSEECIREELTECEYEFTEDGERV